MEKVLEDYNSGEYHYFSLRELERILDLLEDAIVNTKRKIRDIEKNG